MCTWSALLGGFAVLTRTLSLHHSTGMSFYFHSQLDFLAVIFNHIIIFKTSHFPQCVTQLLDFFTSLSSIFKVHVANTFVCGQLQGSLSGKHLSAVSASSVIATPGACYLVVEESDLVTGFLEATVSMADLSNKATDWIHVVWIIEKQRCWLLQRQWLYGCLVASPHFIFIWEWHSAQNNLSKHLHPWECQCIMLIAIGLNLSLVAIKVIGLLLLCPLVIRIPSVCYSADCNWFTQLNEWMLLIDTLWCDCN